MRNGFCEHFPTSLNCHHNPGPTVVNYESKLPFCMVSINLFQEMLFFICMHLNVDDFCPVNRAGILGGGSLKKACQEGISG